MPRSPRLSRFASALTVVGMLGLPPGIAGADTPLADVEIRYDLAIAGAGAAEIDLRAKLGTETYRVTGEGRTVGLIDLFARMRFSGKTDGTVAAGDLRPTNHVYDYAERNRARRVKMTYDGRRTPRISAQPPFGRSSNRVPLPASKLTGTIDPASVFVAPAVPGEKPLSAAQCAREFAILDGRVRVDIRLSYLGPGPAGSVRRSSYDGPVIRCRARVSPAGGHKEGSFLSELSRADDIEVWLAPVAGAKYLVPVRLSLPTPIGRAELLARSLTDTPAGKQAALSR